MKTFTKGQRVVVTSGGNTFEGVVVESYIDFIVGDIQVQVLADGENRVRNYSDDAVEPVKGYMIEDATLLAETLDRARLMANASDEYAIASQRGVYGQIAQALQDTLEVIFVDQVEDHSLFAALAYSAILDGNTVREALALVIKQ